MAHRNTRSYVRRFRSDSQYILGGENGPREGGGALEDNSKMQLRVSSLCSDSTFWVVLQVCAACGFALRLAKVWRGSNGRQPTTAARVWLLWAILSLLGLSTVHTLSYRDTHVL